VLEARVTGRESRELTLRLDGNILTEHAVPIVRIAVEGGISRCKGERVITFERIYGNVGSKGRRYKEEESGNN